MSLKCEAQYIMVLISMDYARRGDPDRRERANERLSIPGSPVYPIAAHTPPQEGPILP